MEFRQKKTRGELDELGYYQPLSLESVPLVERLLADLKTTTENLQKYMNIAQKAIEERDNLQLGAEPYKCDNARLVAECNDLHFQFLRNQEENDKIQKDLNRQVEFLKRENSDCLREKEKLINRVRDLEVELIDRGEILLKSKQRKPVKTSSSSALIKDIKLGSAMGLAEQKISNLSKEIKKLKEQNLELIEANEMLQCQCTNRDREISRLSNQLQGGRSLNAVRKDCLCTKDSNERINVLHDQVNQLTKGKSSLESQLKESLAKQHEAMKRALHLAERNKILEKEMKDIDNLALAVEAECNNTVKTNTEKITRLQDRMHGTVIQIQNLERENAKLKQEKKELSSDLDAVILEKKHLQTVLETSLDEKKRLSDKINNFTIIEHDLNMEIDRLTRLSGEQKRKMAELEGQLISGRADYFTVAEQMLPRNSQVSSFSQTNNGQTMTQSPEASPTRQKQKGTKKRASKKPSKNGSPVRRISKSGSPQRLPPADSQMAGNTPQTGTRNDCCKCCENCSASSKHLKELLDKELDYREQHASKCIENLKSEKDYYMKEYHRMLEQMKSGPGPLDSGVRDKNSELAQRLVEKEQLVASLQHENRILSQEKYDLMARLESARERPVGDNGPCTKMTCKRNERERGLLRADVERLEEERDVLKVKLKTLTESNLSDNERLRTCLNEAEEQIRKLEKEKRELSQSQGSRRVALDSLEGQCEGLKDQLRTAQSELNHQKILYTQLRTLHEQTDRSLNEAQSRLAQKESELAGAIDSLKRKDLDRGGVNKEVEGLKSDIQIMRNQMTQLHHEKDDLLTALDDKTERLTLLEVELKTKNKTIAALETAVGDLKKRLNMTMDEAANQEHLIRTSNSELANLRRDLESARQTKGDAMEENKRLQDDLAAVTLDCRNARKEIDLYKRQIEDLKSQLQHYVAEVKRTEDLISNKEIERSELLDQFRSLSMEANVLENNNHSLENEASQTRVQLSVALDHAGDLERKLENKDSIIRSYERQIADLASQVASLEIQLKQCMAQYDLTENDLQKMRDLCHKLDTENDTFKRQLRDREDQKVLGERKVDHLRSERDAFQQAATKDRRNVEHFEKNLDDAKQESTELKILNQDLQEEVQKLKVQVKELGDKLAFCLCDLNYSPTPPAPNKMTDAASSQITTLLLNDSKDDRKKDDSSKRNFVIFENYANFTDSHSNEGPNTMRSSEFEELYAAEKPEHVSERNYPESSKAKSTMTEHPGRVVDNVTVDSDRNGTVRSCFTANGRRLRNYVANYTIVHEVESLRNASNV